MVWLPAAALDQAEHFLVRHVLEFSDAVRHILVRFLGCLEGTKTCDVDGSALPFLEQPL